MSPNHITLVFCTYLFLNRLKLYIIREWAYFNIFCSTFHDWILGDGLNHFFLNNTESTVWISFCGAEIDPALEGVSPEMRVPALDPPPAAVLVGRLRMQVVCVRGKDSILATPAAMQVPGRHPERVPRRFRRPHPETRFARHRRWRDLGR